ncbi:DUF3859 domain-containing protein [Paucidesulfovibrio longus]|uniref:DUF3859 domain-containing protein n=1 Tax=Paucidesulfovibrio longus TaxID=889 RepID=UPI0003B6A97F|nr:DUF3859 domain-containing protein [Paucidesulfovibrio longus]
MRAMLSTLLLLAALSGAAAAGAASLVQLDLIDHGILASGDGLAGKEVRIAQRTERIPGREGLAFGVTFRLTGSKDGADVAYQTVISFRPARGAEDGSPRPRIAKTHHTRIGAEEALWHRLTKEQAAVPGQWLLRISQGGRVLLEKIFLVEPE